MHALQGDGEIAGHTCNALGTVTLQLHLLKDLGIDGELKTRVVLVVLEDFLDRLR